MDLVTLNNRINSVESQIRGLMVLQKNLEQAVVSKPNLSDLKKSEDNLRSSMNKMSDDISALERRLSKVLLPSETRYYLEEKEVESFRSNFSQLRAMIAKFEQQYNALVAYATSLEKK